MATGTKKKHVEFWDSLKEKRECPVCGKRIGLFGGFITHKGFCNELYSKAWLRYKHSLVKLTKE